MKVNAPRVQGESCLQKVGKIRMWRGTSAVAALGAFMICAPGIKAEVCTVQSKMQPEVRDALSAAALKLAQAVQANDVAAVRSATVAEYATDFSASEYLIRTASTKMTGETLDVTYMYGLDATSHKAGGDADFTCAEAKSEVDFSIAGLPVGNYGFVMVEATGGTQPWLLSFLLRQDGGAWKMAGFYTHARTAAGHDGVWYWSQARAAAKAKQPWAAWLLYGEATSLLSPAGFLQSSNMDKLLSEQRAAAPPELSNGISKEAPLVLKGAGGAEFHFTGMNTERSDDGTKVNVVLHLKTDSTMDAAAARVRSDAAAKAFVTAHPEVRSNFQGVWVFAETDAQQPLAITQRDMSQIP